MEENCVREIQTEKKGNRKREMGIVQATTTGTKKKRKIMQVTRRKRER